MSSPIPEPRQKAVERALMGAFGTTELDAATPMTGGLSGAGLFRIRVGGISYVMRIEPPPHNFGDPARGFVCMRIAAEAVLAPRVRYDDPADGVVIMDLVPERSLALDYPGDGNPLIVELAQAIRILHATPPFPPLVDYMDGMQMVIGQQLQSGLFDPSIFQDLMDRYGEVAAVYRTAAGDRVSSHNDLNPGNVLYDGTRLWLVDWEASFLADRYVDLAAVASWFTRDAAQEDLLLSTYFGAVPTGEQQARFTVMRQINHVLYGMIMLNGAAVERPGVRLPDRDLSGPTLSELDRRLWTGDFGLQAWDDRVAYGKARLAEALIGMQTDTFKNAMTMLAT